MANEDLKKKLEVLEISYPGNASRKQLEALLEEAAKLPEEDALEFSHKAEPEVAAPVEQAPEAPEEKAEPSQEATDVAQRPAESETAEPRSQETPDTTQTEPEPTQEPEAPQEKTEPAQVPLVQVKTTVPGSHLNVRKTPGGEILGTVADGTPLAATGDEVDGWRPVNYKGEPAYVMAKFVVANG